MLVCASIIAQPIESQGNKKIFSTIMQGNYADFAQSVVAIVDFFARQALAGSCSIKRIIKTKAARAIPIVAKTRGPVAADPCGRRTRLLRPQNCVTASHPCRDWS